MGKMIRSYSIFVLFLLMSISIFAGWGNGKTPPGQARKKIGVKDIDVTNYPEIKIILSGNNGKKTILNDKITETSGWSISGIANPLGNNKTEVIYRTPIKSKVKPGDRVEIELYIYNGNVKNGNWIQTYYKVPDFLDSKSIEIKTYEEIYGWENGERTTIDDSGRTYIFTKGGDYFHKSKPIIYVEIPEDNTDEKGKLKITKIKVEKLDSYGRVIRKKNFKITKNTRYREIELDFIREEANIVRVTPIAADKYNIDETPKILNFIVDTKINSSYLDDEDIIGELKSGEINIKLSEFQELSGINKYSYTLSNGFQREGKGGTVDGGKYLTPTEDGKLDDVKIQLGNFSEGSRLTLSFTVYDRLGHEKTYEKTYFVSKQSDGIAAKVSGEVKLRRSKIKIITEGSKEKFGIGSSIDRSSEEDETSISGS
ncbi:hypothetical protein NRK67_08100 [Fusobacteria bacterium ZRK30]|nr:hypothetical protein NRK67_08100 [Fusobacteria bacterium ZRK30]